MTSPAGRQGCKDCGAEYSSDQVKVFVVCDECGSYLKLGSKSERQKATPFSDTVWPSAGTSEVQEY